MFLLVHFVIALALITVAALGGMWSEEPGPLGFLTVWIYGAYGLGTLLPMLGVSVRRLHDTGRGGAWVLTYFIPCIGWIIYLFLMAQPGEPDDNGRRLGLPSRPIMTAHALVEALAFLYLTFGQATDGTLTAEEMRTLASKLQKRAPDLSLEDLGLLLRRTVDAYKTSGTREDKIDRAQAHAQVLRDAVDETMREDIVGDLMAIAGADGEVSEEELAFIERTAQTLGVPMPQ